MMRFINPEEYNRKAMKNGKILSEIQCWFYDCPYPLVVHGYPFYICKNHHAYNDKTGKETFWIPIDLVYNPLLYLGEVLVEKYQALFFPNSRSRKNKEADRIHIDLTEIGEILYDLLNITEELKYNWDRETFQHHAGLRFSSNMMSKAINDKIAIILQDFRWDLHVSAKESYTLNAKELLSQYSQDQLKDMLLTVQTEFNITLYKRYLEVVIAKNSFKKDGIPQFELEAWKDELKVIQKKNLDHRGKI